MTKDQTPILLGVTWSFTGFATVLVGLRFYCRARYISRIWWDDFWMAVSLLFSLAMAVTWTVFASLGGANTRPLDHDQMVQINQINWISQVWVVTALVTGKIAIASLISRLQAPCRWRSIVLWVVPGIITCWATAQIVMFFTQCRPVQKIWDPDVPGTCWRPEILVANGQGNAAYFGFCDLLLAALPVEMIWRLQMPLRRKVALCCLLSLGVVACAVTIVNIVMLTADLHPASDKASKARSTVLLYVWNALEVNVVIIAGCIPTIVPLIQILRGKQVEKYPTLLGGPYRSSISRVLTQRVPMSFRHRKRRFLHFLERDRGSSVSPITAKEGVRTSFQGIVSNPLDSTGQRSNWEIGTSSTERTIEGNILVTADVDIRYSMATLPP